MFNVYFTLDRSRGPNLQPTNGCRWYIHIQPTNGCGRYIHIQPTNGCGQYISVRWPVSRPASRAPSYLNILLNTRPQGNADKQRMLTNRGCGGKTPIISDNHSQFVYWHCDTVGYISSTMALYWHCDTVGYISSTMALHFSVDSPLFALPHNSICPPLEMVHLEEHGLNMNILPSCSVWRSICLGFPGASHNASQWHPICQETGNKFSLLTKKQIKPMILIGQNRINV